MPSRKPSGRGSNVQGPSVSQFGQELTVTVVGFGGGHLVSGRPLTGRHLLRRASGEHWVRFIRSQIQSATPNL